MTDAAQFELVFIGVIKMHINLQDLLEIRRLGLICSNHRMHCQHSPEAHGGLHKTLNVIVRDACRLDVRLNLTPIPWRPTPDLRPWGASCAVALPPALLGQIS